MKVAVTGVDGFVGRHVLNQLKLKGIQTVAISRNNSGVTNFEEEARVFLDISNAGKDTYDQLGRPDALIHLAWGGLPNYLSLHHFEQELPNHYRFLHYLIDAGLQSVTVAGTCFEYGMQSGCLSETTEPSCSLNPYGYAKNALMQQLMFLQEKTPFNLVWGRLFYLYGIGQSKNSLFSQLKQAVAKGDRTFNMSGGEQLRDYLSVEVAAKYLVDLTLCNQNVGVVNICSGAPISVRKLVEEWLISEKYAIELNLGFFPYPTYEPMAFWGDTKKLSSTIDVIKNAK